MDYFNNGEEMWKRRRAPWGICVFLEFGYFIWKVVSNDDVCVDFVLDRNCIVDFILRVKKIFEIVAVCKKLD